MAARGRPLPGDRTSSSTRGRAGEVYNVGGGDERTNLHITERLLDLCGADDSMVRRVADRKGHDLRYALDETKIREELGYTPRVDFERGLAETVAWYRDNPGWWKAVQHRTDVSGRPDREGTPA